MRHRLLALATIAVVGLSQAGRAETISVTIVAGHPPVFRWVRMFPEAFEPAAQAALEGTDYKFDFVEQFGGTIAGVGEELETVGDGLAEIGTIQSVFDPAKLALQNVSYYTPFVSDDLRLVGTTVEDMIATVPEMKVAYDENGIVPLGGPMALDSYLLFTKFPVKSLADLKGKKISGAGPSINWLNGTGAVGVSGQIPTYYNDLRTGVYDGVVLFATAALPGKLYEVAPYITRVGFGAQYAGDIGANKDWYDSQPPEVQTALRAGADAARDWYIKSLEETTQSAMTTMAGKGATISNLSPEAKAAWVGDMGDIAGDWARDLDTQGLPGSKILDLYMQRMKAGGARPVRDWGTE